MPCTIAMRIQYHPGPKWLIAASFNERDIKIEGVATLRKDLIMLGMGNLQPRSQNVVQSKMPGALEVFWNAANETHQRNVRNKFDCLSVHQIDSCSISFLQLYYLPLDQATKIPPTAQPVQIKSSNQDTVQMASVIPVSAIDTANECQRPVLSLKERVGIVVPSEQRGKFSASTSALPPAPRSITFATTSSHARQPDASDVSSLISTTTPQEPSFNNNDILLANLREELEALKQALTKERALRETVSNSLSETSQALTNKSWAFEDMSERCTRAEERERLLVAELNRQQDQMAKLENSHVTQTEAHLREIEMLKETQRTVVNRLNGIGSHASQDIFVALDSVEWQIADGTAKLHATEAALNNEADERHLAEQQLKQEQRRHARIIRDIEKEMKDPFVVPALLSAFVNLSDLTERAVQSGMR